LEKKMVFNLQQDKKGRGSYWEKKRRNFSPEMAVLQKKKRAVSLI